MQTLFEKIINYWTAVAVAGATTYVRFTSEQHNGIQYFLSIADELTH
jgi:hypothetical protein